MALLTGGMGGTVYSTGLHHVLVVGGVRGRAGERRGGVICAICPALTLCVRLGNCLI